MGKETHDQSGNSGTNVYEVPCRASILETAGSLPYKKSMMKANAPTPQRILLQFQVHCDSVASNLIYQ